MQKKQKCFFFFLQFSDSGVLWETFEQELKIWKQHGLVSSASCNYHKCGSLIVLKS